MGIPFRTNSQRVSAGTGRQVMRAKLRPRACRRYTRAPAALGGPMRLGLRLGAVAAALSAAQAVLGCSQALAACTDGRYLLTAPLITRDGGPATDVLTVAGSQVTLASGCPTTTARIKPRKRFTQIVVMWPACSGLPGKATLKARVDAATCARMSGTFAVRAKPRRKPVAFTAGHSRCGDGVPDAGAGERCEQGDSCCTATCELQTAGTPCAGGGGDAAGGGGAAGPAP